MNSAEYEQLERMEREHWYYAGKRELVRKWLERARPPQVTDRLLDCGAGTGLFAAEMAERLRVLVLDDHEESLRMLVSRFQPDQILRAQAAAIPLPAASVEYITALDVLEHVPDDAAAVRDFSRVLKPGGLALVTVPASMSLWSQWDVALHHYRRYRRPELQRLFSDKDWDIVYINYTNCLIFPAVWLVRRWGDFRRNRSSRVAGARSEDRLFPGWLNQILKALFVRPGLSRMPLPFGVSLILVARRRESLAEAG